MGLERPMMSDELPGGGTGADTSLSEKHSTPPMTLPLASRSTEAVISSGTRLPSRLRKCTLRLTSLLPWLMAFWR